MAKVAVTNGRLNFDRRALRALVLLLFFADFMLQRCNFLLHLAKLHMTDLTARFVKEINQSTGRAARQNNQETHRANKDRDRFRHPAETVQHDLENFLAQSDAGETDWQR